MGRKPVACAPVSFALLVERCSSDVYLRVRRGQRPTGGCFNKHPADNHKGIGGSSLLHVLAHFSFYALVKDYRSAIRYITLVDGYTIVL